MKTEEQVSPSAQGAVTQATNDRAALDRVTRNWSDWEHSPVYYTGSSITFYENGDWEASCNAHNRSGHSDWDVTGTYQLISTATGAVIAGLGHWFQDLDSGENYNKSASGNSSQVRDGFAYIKDGSYSAHHNSHLVRDN